MVLPKNSMSWPPHIENAYIDGLPISMPHKETRIFISWPPHIKKSYVDGLPI